MATEKKNSESASAQSAAPTSETNVAVGKGHATPTRKEREAARKRPLVPTDRKLAAKEARAANAASRDRARAGYAAGDERYMPVRDRGPQKRFARDYVDARYSFGELLVPFMFLIILTSFFQDQFFAVLSISLMWGFIAVLLIDLIVLSNALRRRLERKFGPGSIERGVRWYAMMRAIQLRPMRMPKPQVARRQYPS